MGAENLDPLGLGRIDTRQLALVSCTCLLSPTPLLYSVSKCWRKPCADICHDKVVCRSILYVTCVTPVMSRLDNNAS